MSEVATILKEEPARAEHVTSTRAESTASSYFARCILVCCVIYLFPFLLLRLAPAKESLLSYWGTVVNASYSSERQDADVVIFGDSTAATNIDPVRMTNDLHLKTIVLPNTSTSLPVSGFGPLDRYLKQNKRPKLIVFYLSGWDLDFMHNPFTQIVEEGEEMLLIHGSSQQVLRYALANPRKILMFPLHFYGNTNRIGDLLHFRKHETPDLDQGHIVRLTHATPMAADCAFNLERTAMSSKDSSSREAVRQFTQPGTRTLLFISPLPACKHLEAVKDILHPGLDIAPPQILPPADFREDGWQAHMLTGKIGPSTNYLEEVIREKLSMSVATQQ